MHRRLCKADIIGALGGKIQMVTFNVLSDSDVILVL